MERVAGICGCFLEQHKETREAAGRLLTSDCPAPFALEESVGNPMLALYGAISVVFGIGVAESPAGSSHLSISNLISTLLREYFIEFSRQTRKVECCCY